MKITTVLFDLDGTLLPMDQDLFVRTYFGRISAHMAPYGYDPKELTETIWRGTAAMVKNDGSRTNEAAFWDTVAGIYGQQILADQSRFDRFYEEKFDTIREVCGFAPEAAQVVYGLKEQGVQVVLATNPIFPARATQCRIRWAGLQPEDFALYTTYENSRFSKPNPAYYREILQKLQLQPENCLMVGNDVGEDMIARQLGMQVFLLTDCLINKTGASVDQYPHGSFKELLAYLENSI